jgi:hypothetical protein
LSIYLELTGLFRTDWALPHPNPADPDEVQVRFQVETLGMEALGSSNWQIHEFPSIGILQPTGHHFDANLRFLRNIDIIQTTDIILIDFFEPARNRLIEFFRFDPPNNINSKKIGKIVIYLPPRSDLRRHLGLNLNLDMLIILNICADIISKCL